MGNGTHGHFRCQKLFDKLQAKAMDFILRGSAQYPAEFPFELAAIDRYRLQQCFNINSIANVVPYITHGRGNMRVRYRQDVRGYANLNIDGVNRDSFACVSLVGQQKLPDTHSFTADAGKILIDAG